MKSCADFRHFRCPRTLHPRQQPTKGFSPNEGLKSSLTASVRFGASGSLDENLTVEFNDAITQHSTSVQALFLQIVSAKFFHAAELNYDWAILRRHEMRSAGGDHDKTSCGVAF